VAPAAPPVLGIQGQTDTTSPPASPSAWQSAWDTIKTGATGAWDFGRGFVLQGKDTVVGIIEMATDPIGTAKGLWQAATHPPDPLQAIKTSLVDAWNDNPSEFL